MRVFLLPLLLNIFAVCSYAQGYFQQEVNYTIHVSLDDQNHMLRARQDSVYSNNSPDTLKVLWFHLWPNGYSNLNTAFARQLRNQGNLDFQFSNEEEKGSIDSLDFTIESKPVSWKINARAPDICKLILNEAIPPGAKVNISTPFRVKIPSAEFSRLGHSKQAYFITQWYPKPAVYDRNGWHPMPYLNQGEFYSEFGSFDVYITLPDNYIVAATGKLTDCDEEQKRIDSLAAVTAQLTGPFIAGESKIPSSLKTKTLHFFQDKIHDFAWFADKQYAVLQGEVELPISHRKVKTAVYFIPDKKGLWKDAVGYVNNAIYYNSLWVGEYPYDQATAVQGVLSAGAGMEYPTITIIGSSGTARSLEEVIFHEVTHNWFYGILGFNERQHPWMDEGLTSCYSDRYMELRYPWREKKDSKAAFGFIRDLKVIEDRLKYLAWAYTSNVGLDLPSTLPADKYPSLQYGVDVYYQSSLNFNYLAKAAGQARFDTAMHKFYRNWSFRHPQPEDLRLSYQGSFKGQAGYFDAVAARPGILDYKLKRMKRETTPFDKEMITVEVVNKGGLLAPFQIAAMKGNTIDTSWWMNGILGTQSLYFENKDYSSLVIDPLGYMPEVSRRNNQLKTHGIFPHGKPLGFRILYGLPDPAKNRVYLLPALGKNTTDKFMAGLALYNDPFFSKHWEWVVVPMYAFGTEQLNGLGRLSYVIHPVGESLREARLGLGYKRFSFQGPDYVATSTKITPFLEMEFRSKDPLSPYRTIIAFRRPQLNIADERENQDGSQPQFSDQFRGDYSMNELTCMVKNVRSLHPWSGLFKFQQNEYFARISLEGNARFIYNPRLKALYLRVFVGQYITSDSMNLSDPGFHVGGIGASDDVYFDGIYPGRNETTGVYSQQFIEDEGAVKGPGQGTRVYNSLVSMNLKFDIPIGLPLRIFMDAAYYPGFSDKGELPMTLGISVPIVKNDIFEIFFPIYSSSLDDFDNKMVDHYGQKIKFTLNLHKLDFLRKAKTLIP